MATALLPLGILALAATLVAEVFLLDRWLFGRRSPRRGRRLLRSRGVGPTQPVGRPLQEVAADLRRLGEQLALVPAGAPMVRWAALWAAYDAVLAEAAGQLEVPQLLALTPEGMPRGIERLRVLAALECAGLVVRR